MVTRMTVRMDSFHFLFKYENEFITDYVAEGDVGFGVGPIGEDESGVTCKQDEGEPNAGEWGERARNRMPDGSSRKQCPVFFEKLEWIFQSFLERFSQGNGKHDPAAKDDIIGLSIIVADSALGDSVCRAAQAAGISQIGNDQETVIGQELLSHHDVQKRRGVHFHLDAVGVYWVIPDTPSR